MSSPMFDDQYGSRPQVSLRGASIQVERGGLLERAHKEREFRENVRIQRLAAVSFQALYRGYRVRSSVYTQFRSRFDELCKLCSCSNDVLGMCRLFMVFYSKNSDEERLIKLCQKWIQFRSELSLVVAYSESWFLHLTRLLVHSSNSLPSPKVNPALLLRTIEIFLHSSTYPLEEAHGLISRLNTHLVKNKFFRSLLSLMEVKILPPDDLNNVPSPLVTSLLGYMTRPLMSNDDLIIYGYIASEVLSFSSSPHVCYFVIPHLINSDLNLEVLVHSVLVGVVSGRIPPSLELLYGISRLVQFRLTSPNLQNRLILDYLQVVSLLLDHTPPGHVTSMDIVDSDGEDAMGVDKLEGTSPLSSPEAMLRHCLATIGGEEIPKCIRLKKPLPFPVLNAISAVCYQLIRHCHTLHYNKTHLFQLFALNSDLLSPMWSNLTQMVIERTFGEPVSCLQQLARGLPLPSPQDVGVVQNLSTFSSLFTFYLNTLHDAEFYRERDVPIQCHLPFSLSELPEMVGILRDIFLCLHLDKHLPQNYSISRLTKATTKPHPQEWSKLKLLLLDLLCALYQRDCRRPFCPEGHWVSPGLHIDIPPGLYTQEGEVDMDDGPPHHLKQVELLKTTPYVFSFIERVKFFRSLIHYDHTGSQGHLQEFLMGPSISLTIRRDHVYEDAFAELAKDADLRKKLRVNFVNSQGLGEAGIDGGGIVREFLDEVLKTGFDPNRGYFSITADGQLYPNPQSHLINEDSNLHYHFLGAMLGKSLYEGQLIELPFAGFFLCKLAIGGRGIVGAHHLASFDPDLYRNLLSLKYFDGDIEDLSLNFTVATDGLGQSKVHELKKGGTDISVTKGNCVKYIHLMAHHRLNVQLHQQFQSFRSGMKTVIPYHWLRLFSQNELQVLISGAEVPISVHDLRQNTSYSGVYKDDHVSIALFWEVVGSFSEKQKRQLLKFVTSCSRPPLLGFKELHPPFKISPGVGDSHLPSASTCMNLLKLPMFKDKDTLKDKLIYAIQSGAGFELS